eukprot:PLAT14376.1.p1 GENE.PLAT14376.1~~PLAT14376.1.p1  ORF type:complete len:454 (+),score=179.94 PLAT14376.1:66-1364(+)
MTASMRTASMDMLPTASLDEIFEDWAKGSDEELDEMLPAWDDSTPRLQLQLGGTPADSSLSDASSDGQLLGDPSRAAAAAAARAVAAAPLSLASPRPVHMLGGESPRPAPLLARASSLGSFSSLLAAAHDMPTMPYDAAASAADAAAAAASVAAPSRASASHLRWPSTPTASAAEDAATTMELEAAAAAAAAEVTAAAAEQRRSWVQQGSLRLLVAGGQKYNEDELGCFTLIQNVSYRFIVEASGLADSTEVELSARYYTGRLLEHSLLDLEDPQVELPADTAADAPFLFSTTVAALRGGFAVKFHKSPRKVPMKLVLRSAGLEPVEFHYQVRCESTHFSKKRKTKEGSSRNAKYRRISPPAGSPAMAAASPRPLAMLRRRSPRAAAAAGAASGGGVSSPFSVPSVASSSAAAAATRSSSRSLRGGWSSRRR